MWGGTRGGAVSLLGAHRDRELSPPRGAFGITRARALPSCAPPPVRPCSPLHELSDDESQIEPLAVLRVFCGSNFCVPDLQLCL